MKGSLGALMGMPVIVSANVPENVPVIELRSDVVLSDEFRAKTNAWYLEMFGTKSVVYMFGDSVVMNPKHAAMLKINNN